MLRRNKYRKRRLLRKNDGKILLISYSLIKEKITYILWFHDVMMKILSFFHQNVLKSVIKYYFQNNFDPLGKVIHEPRQIRYQFIY